MTIMAWQEEKLNDIITAVKAREEELSGWEAGFFSDQVRRFEEYGSHIFLSEKQWGVLDRIYEKITGEPYGARVDLPDDDIPF